jgi:hypothetical protein
MILTQLFPLEVTVAAVMEAHKTRLQLLGLLTLVAEVAVKVVTVMAVDLALRVALA